MKMPTDRRAFLRQGATLSFAALPFAGSVAYAETAFTFAELVDSFSASWNRSKTYMLEVAEAMPADSYAYRPTPEIRSFAEQMLHVAASVYGFASVIKNEPIPVPQDQFNAAGKSKEVILTTLEQALDFAASAIVEISEERALETTPWGGRLYDGMTEMPVFGVIRVLHDHTTHHRGQAIIYLRMQGIAPPTYVD
ncbi:MAG TPA: DinB family protein [Rhodothermales bacterium]|nr:DinB family protein [Rhodothermales bacterium]